MGTPFKNVEGELYICLEVCHLGSFVIVQNPELPREEEYAELLWIIINLIVK